MADEEDLYKGPLAERVLSKNWKVRRAAFEELQQKFKEATDNTIFEEYAPKFKKIIEDKNAAAQEKGLDALLTWIDRAEAPTKLNGLCQTLAVNCFGGRSNTVQKAVDALLLFIEVDKSGEAVITTLLTECFNKQWKISSTCISTIALALKTFGSKVVPLKPVLKEVAKMFEDSNAKVREEAQKLVIEMYRWAGAALKPTVDTLRPAQVKDLNTAFEALPKTKAVPEKYLRCEQPQDDEEEAPAGRASGGGGGADEEEEDASGMDAYELAEPVDVLSKLPGDWYDKVASPKWKERNEQMDALLSLINTPRLQPGDYRELTKTIKKIIDKDANVTVVAKAAQAAGQLAKGLRQHYSPDAKNLVSTLLAKFKEKKANVVTAIHEALDQMMDMCFTLPDLAEDLPPAADAKTPPGREQTLVFITRFIVKSKRASVGQAIKFLGPLLLKAMDDGTPEVREASYKAFGTLVGKVGERPLAPYLTKLDGIKEKKVKENYPEKIFTGTLNPTAANAKPQAANAKPAPSKKPAATGGAKPAATGAANAANAAGPRRAGAAAPAASGNKPATAAQPPKPATAEAKPGALGRANVAAPAAASAARPEKEPAAKPAAPAPKPAAPKPKPKPAIPAELPLISPEEAMEKAKAVLPETTLPQLEDGAWKNRVAGMDELAAQLDKLLEKDDALMVQVILRLIEQKPGFKDANFQVMQKVLQTIARLAKSQFFTKSMAELVMAVLVDKIADIKLRNVAIECLNGVVEAVGLDFVLREVYKHATENKNPKVANEVLGWVGTAIEDFGIQGPPAPVDVKLLVDFVKAQLEHSNSMVRSSATKTITKIFTFVGDAIKEHLGDVKPALMSTIEKEFAKYANAKPDPPTKFYRQKEAVAPAEEESEPEPVAEAGSAEPEPEPESVQPEPASKPARAASGVAAKARAPAAPIKAAAPAPASVDDSWVEGAVDEYDDEEEVPAEPARADITPLLTPQLFAELANAKDWKLRKEALDKIRRILSEANMSIQSNCLAALMPKLNARLKDTNKNLVLYTVKLLGILATAVGRDVESQMKITVPLILANYTDQKQTMRDTVTKTLDQWATEVGGADAFVPFFPAAIVIESSSARKDALAWLVARKHELGKSADARVLLKPAITALQDKTPDVRRLSEELLEELFARVDSESIRAVLKDVKLAALKQQVVALAKKARGSGGSSAGSTTSSNDGSEKSFASVSSARSNGSVTPGSTTAAKVRATPKSAEKPGSPATAGSGNSPTRRTSATTPTSLGRDGSKPALRLPSAQPLVPNEDKAKRQRQDDNISDEGRGWTFKSPRPEHAQHLQQQAKPYLSEGLYAKMFSKDFRKHREALQELAAAIGEHVEETKQNADLLLKWASLRLFDANTSTQTKTLAFLTHLLDVLDTNEYHLTDYEAGIILPVLLECMGQGEAMQEGVSGLLRIVPRVYPSSKFFGFLLNAGLLGSKSPRTRAECLEQMAVLIRKQGLTVCPNPSVAFPQVVQFVTDKVSAVRNAALAVIQQAHLHVGDDLWLYTGTLNDTQRALINQKMGGDSPLRQPSTAPVPHRESAIQKVMQDEERKARASSPSAALKTKPTVSLGSSSSSTTAPASSLGSSKSAIGTRNANATSSPAVATRRAVASRSKPTSEDGSSSAAPASFSLELDKLPAAKGGKPSSGSRVAPALEPTSVSSASLTAPTPSLPTRLMSRTAPAEPSLYSSAAPAGAASNVIIETWMKDLESGDVDRIIAVCKAVLEKLAEGASLFVGCSDGLAKILAGLLNSTLRQKDFSVDKNREFKYFVNVLFKLFSQAPVAIGISREASKYVLHSLMVAFVDPLVVPRSDADTANNLYKGIQLATMKVLRNTDQTAIFTTLLEMLDDVLGGEPLTPPPKGFAEVLIKALTIAIQHIKETIDEMNLDQVLFDLNAFLEAHHGRGEEGDVSVKAKLRLQSVHLCHAAVKEIVTIKGRAGVSRHLSLVPVAKYPAPVVVRVINKILKETFGAAGEAITAEDVKAEQEDDAQLAAKIELKQIMQRLSSNERPQAITDLYYFKVNHPNIDIQPYLATATTQFQTYVRRALMSVEEKENVPIKPDPVNSSSSSSSTAAGGGGGGSEYVDKLRALQKRYGHTAGSKHGPTASLSSSTDSTTLTSLGAPTKPAGAGGGSSIHDLRLRLNTVMRSAGVPAAQQPTDADMPSTSGAPSLAGMGSTDAVQHLKARLARIKQTAAGPSI